MSNLYKTAADVLQRVLEGRQGLKTLVYSSDSIQPGQHGKIYALVSQTVLYRSVLELLLSRSRLDSIGRSPTSYYIVMVMIYDLLFGQGSITGGGSLKAQIVAQGHRLHTLLDQHKASVQAQTNLDLIPIAFRDRDRLPRYGRVNTLLTNLSKVMEQLGSDDVTIDDHIPNLLRFPSSSSLHDHVLVSNAHLILQDKASCFPAHILLDTDHDLRHLIDACSAPGNKTLQLAAGLRPGAQLTAFERDRSRYETLQRRLQQAGAGGAEARCADFRSCSPRDAQFADVDAILVDPTCSGSGLVGHRIEALLQNATMSPDDLQRLQTQQMELVLHAMRFPSVRRITYSTCSVHRAENEDVVEKVLRRQPNWQLGEALASFPGRGLPSEQLPNAHLCVRSSPHLQTHGFFVALFVRKPDTDTGADARPSSGRTTTRGHGLAKPIGKRRRLKKRLFLR